MRVDQLMTNDVACCSSDSTLHEAARLMWESDCGCLPVCAAGDSREVVGTITDRDICMSAWLQGRPLQDICVTDAMTKQVHTCHPSDPLLKVERVMSDARIRRMPVVDERDRLVGMITLADLAREAEREQVLQSREITGNDISLTLASICQPGSQTQVA